MRYRRVFEAYREKTIEKSKNFISRSQNEGKTIAKSIENRLSFHAQKMREKATVKGEKFAAYHSSQPQPEKPPVPPSASPAPTAPPPPPVSPKRPKQVTPVRPVELDRPAKPDRPAKQSKRSKDSNSKTKPKKMRKTLQESMNDLFSLLHFNITFKLTMNNLLALIILASIFGYLLSTTLSYVRYTEEHLQFNGITKYMYSYVSNPDTLRQDDFRNFVKANRLEYSLRDGNGKYIYLTKDYDGQAMRRYDFFDFIFSKTPKYIFEEKQIQLKGETYTLLFFEEYNQDSMYMQGFYQLVLGLGNCMIIIFAVWTNGITKRTLQPIKGMTHTVQEITVQSLNKRIDITGTKDELRDLAVTFNDMMDHIQSSYEKQKQFVSDASHELRTPIAIIQGYVGMLERWGKNDPEILAESIEAIRDESHNMQSLVEKLLFIARSEKGKIEYEMEIIECHSLLTSMVNDFSMIDPNHTFSLECEFMGKIAGNKDALIQLFRIFIDNSIKYTPDGGAIAVRCYEQSHQVIVEIEDNGIGIAAEDLPRIFDRFFRADRSRTRLDEKAKGFGLGLSIARIILEAHNAIVIPTSEINKGTKMQIVFSTVLTDDV